MAVVIVFPIGKGDAFAAEITRDGEFARLGINVDVAAARARSVTLTFGAIRAIDVAGAFTPTSAHFAKNLAADEYQDGESQSNLDDKEDVRGRRG